MRLLALPPRLGKRRLLAVERIRPDMNNLLVALRRWVSKQDENFATESLAHLLKHLAEHEEKIAAALLTRLTAGRVSFSGDEARKAQIMTQPTTDRGRPDIEIS